MFIVVSLDQKINSRIRSKRFNSNRHIDTTLIANKEYSQIKHIVNDMKKAGMEESIQHKKGFRPWGHYLSIAKGDSWQVKLIEVNLKVPLSSKTQF